MNFWPKLIALQRFEPPRPVSAPSEEVIHQLQLECQSLKGEKEKLQNVCMNQSISMERLTRQLDKVRIGHPEQPSEEDEDKPVGPLQSFSTENPHSDPQTVQMILDNIQAAGSKPHSDQP